MTLAIPHRLVVPVPEGGWLSLWTPASKEERLSLAEDWRLMAKSCLVASKLRVRTPVNVRVECRPKYVADTGEPGIHQGEDLRPSWHMVREVLAKRRIYVRGEEMVLGAPTGELDPLMVVEFGVVRGVR